MNQSQLEAISRVATAVWPAITALAGVLIGGFVANRNQRKHWIADNKRAEYRELLTTMTKTFNMVMRFSGFISVIPGEEERALAEMESECSVVMKDRIFIAPEVMRINVLGLWLTAREEYRQSSDDRKFTLAFSEIVGKILSSANSEIGQGKWFR